jgi:Uma2 family endonuclease
VGVGRTCHTAPMTALPLPRPRLLTAAEFAALDEATDGRYELQDGNVVMSPSPVPFHQACQRELLGRLHEQVPPDLTVLPAVDLDLELVPPGSPGFVRIPDVLVVTKAAYRRVGEHGGLLRAGDAVLAVEILSPGSLRTDRVIKRGEYADAGIPHHWMVDLDDGPSLTACHLAGEFGYQDAAPERGVLVTDTPFPIRIDVAALLG